MQARRVAFRAGDAERLQQATQVAMRESHTARPRSVVAAPGRQTCCRKSTARYTAREPTARAGMIAWTSAQRGAALATDPAPLVPQHCDERILVE